MLGGMSPTWQPRILAESEFPQWEALVAESPQGSPYALPAYLDALCSAAGGRFRILAVARGGELGGGVPLYEATGPGGHFVSARLLLYYLSPVLAPQASTYPSIRTGRDLQVLETLVGELGTLGYDRVILKCRSTLHDVRPFLAAGWSVRVGYSYVVDLTDLEAAWGRVEQNLRRLVKRCTDQGITWDEDDDFDTFYRLHERTLGRKGVAAYLPRPAFRTYYERLRAAGLGRLQHARLPDGRTLASQLVLAGGHPVTHTVSAAADPEFLRLGGSAFLRWRGFESLAAAGFTANDLTDAALNPVTHFKSQLGGDLVLFPVLLSPASLRWRAVATAQHTGVVGKRVLRRILGQRVVGWLKGLRPH